MARLTTYVFPLYHIYTHGFGAAADAVLPLASEARPPPLVFLVRLLPILNYQKPKS